MKNPYTELAEAVRASISRNGEFNNYTATHSARDIRRLAVAALRKKPDAFLAAEMRASITDLKRAAASDMLDPQRVCADVAACMGEKLKAR